MLSYQHAYHAGNFADVLKHLVLIDILDHLCKKEKAFSYIDTHAGRGLYRLDSEMASKTEEYRDGIRLIETLQWPELQRYIKLVSSFNPGGKNHTYPGSPLLALRIMRTQDRAHLFELHPQELAALQENVATDKRASVSNSDGYRGLPGKLPPPSRRGFALIDPPYEIKSDYDTAINSLIKAHRRFATGIYALWYPVIDRARIDKQSDLLVQSGIKNIQRFELGLSKDTDGFGMTASGMFVINPPWGLLEKMRSLLPKLAGVLAAKGTSIAETLVDE